MTTKIYLIKVTLIDGKIHTWRNQSKDFVDTFRCIVWQCGITVKTDQHSHEQISPQRIKEVLFIDQSHYDSLMEIAKKQQAVQTTGSG